MSQKTKKEQDRRKSKADRFWSAFLFTENGKPKSSFLVYTFSLSFVFAVVYVLCYELSIRLLTDPLSALPSNAGNLVISLLASVLGAAICCIPHFFFKDKRLVFGGHLWLLAYALAILITMLIIMRDTDGIAAFLNFFGWFITIPVAVGCVAGGVLCRMHHHPEEKKESEPEWKKYVQRR